MVEISREAMMARLKAEEKDEVEALRKENARLLQERDEAREAVEALRTDLKEAQEDLLSREAEIESLKQAAMKTTEEASSEAAVSPLSGKAPEKPQVKTKRKKA